MDSIAKPHKPDNAWPMAVAWPSYVTAAQPFDYGIDAWQRSILLLDVLRQRGNNYLEHSQMKAPHVLGFGFDVILRGDELPRPVNYALVRIVPPPDTRVDPALRPFIVFDPRAGHGPGIGGMKHDSQIGAALAAGHPCYFVGFLPEPVPGQTVLDVCSAHAAFVEKVAALHPQAQGKPCLIGNCQAGWQIMMMCAVNPELAGPIILAGSPLSYWAGTRGKNPMRYFGGLLGGSWLAALAGDLGDGIFDGAHLIANFEFLNPSNTYWQKLYNVYSKIDTEPPRFLEFETWWGSPVLLGAEEIQYIVDELFVGNKLSSGALVSADGVRIDLRNIRSPIVVFCSHGDNITPPQQALDWILDLYEKTDDIAASGQTIIYSLHPSVGHLGIFVSAKVATKEHEEFTENMDFIDVLPPGLYEATIAEPTPETAHRELVSGKYILRFEPRTLDDIRALGVNTTADDLCFSAVARTSEIGESLYETFVRPMIKPWVNAQTAALLRQMHPIRLRFSAFSDGNPLMSPVAQMAASIRPNRRPLDGGHPLLMIEKAVSDAIVTGLDAYRNMRDQCIEWMFLGLYGSPITQSLLGLSGGADTQTRAGRDLARELSAAKALSALNAQFEDGGLMEAFVRALLYIGRSHPQSGADERGFSVLRAIRAERPESRRMSLDRFKAIVRIQHQLLKLDEQRAIEAIPKLLAYASKDDRTSVASFIQRVIQANTTMTAEAARRLSLMDGLFKGKPASSAQAPTAGELERASATGGPLEKDQKRDNGHSVTSAHAIEAAKRKRPSAETPRKS